MSKEYAICSHCNKSNPVRENETEQTCIFCGQPFTVSDDNETQLLSEPVDDNKNRVPETVQQDPLEDVNQRKPVNKNKTQPLR